MEIKNIINKFKDLEIYSCLLNLIELNFLNIPLNSTVKYKMQKEDSPLCIEVFLTLEPNLTDTTKFFRNISVYVREPGESSRNIINSYSYSETSWLEAILKHVNALEDKIKKLSID